MLINYCKFKRDLVDRNLWKHLVRQSLEFISSNNLMKSQYETSLIN